MLHSANSYRAVLLCVAVLAGGCAPMRPLATTVPESANAKDPDVALASWKDTRARQAIVRFVERVTKPGTSFVPEPERIAVFDHDGTLWAEQPLYFQFAFAIDRVNQLAPRHPDWRVEEPFASLLAGDMKGVLAGGEPAMLEIMKATHDRVTVEDYATSVRNWLAVAKHPTTGRPYTEMVYQPMVELLRYLRANGFKTFIVSGSGVDFLRVFAEQVYGIPPEQVIGSVGKVVYETRYGRPTLVKLPEFTFIDDKAGKPVGIYNNIGRRPIAAFGNSDGDLAMLQWTCGTNGPDLCLYVHHTDAEREWAYDRKSSIGRLDLGLDQAARDGWTVVDMKSDWKKVFADPQ